MIPLCPIVGRSPSDDAVGEALAGVLEVMALDVFAEGAVQGTLAEHDRAP
jgi:hypothetical protein